MLNNKMVQVDEELEETLNGYCCLVIYLKIRILFIPVSLISISYGSNYETWKISLGKDVYYSCEALTELLIEALIGLKTRLT